MEEQIKQIADRMRVAIQSGQEATFEVHKGQVKEVTGLKKWISSTFGAVSLSTLLLIFFLVLINEAFGIITIKGRTPLSLIRNLFNKV